MEEVKIEELKSELKSVANKELSREDAAVEYVKILAKYSHGGEENFKIVDLVWREFVIDYPELSPECFRALVYSTIPKQLVESLAKRLGWID